MNSRRRAGFTLLEVLVALVIAGLVALLAHQLFGATIDGSRRVEYARRALDRRWNAQGFLRDALLGLDVGVDSTSPFEGDRNRLRFSTWLLTADGWTERRHVELVGDGEHWTAVVAPDLTIVLADSVRSVAFDYLVEPGADAQWVSVWHSPVSAPLAVRVRLTHAAGASDTMLYLIKTRG
jgi:prepilin-type N-terminal cleavage/methylation domain-containing protein